jgi:molybdate transport system regulatory protein
MEIKHKLWLERDGHVIFGPGREGMLKAIEECHSLSAAAKKLRMSYRAAWGRLKASEERLGIKLVEMDNVKHGMHLTDEAILNETHDKLLSNLSQVTPKKVSGRT